MASFNIILINIVFIDVFVWLLQLCVRSLLLLVVVK